MSIVRTMVVLMVCAMVAPAAFAQDGGRGERQPGGQGGRGGDPAQMRERMMQNLREQMQASEEEWTVLAPKIEKVQTIQRESRGMGGWGRGGRGGDQQEPTTEVGRASRDLRTVLQNENASGEEITKALTAYRAAREKANAELAAAREDLKAVLTPRQEAILVMMGMVE